MPSPGLPSDASRWAAELRGNRLRARDAFDDCWDVYRKARLFLDHKISTVNFGGMPEQGWQPHSRARLAEYAADFALAGRKALKGEHWASRRVLFEVYHLGLVEHAAARQHLGMGKIGELTWMRWEEEIREQVGKELLRRGLHPPSRYFGG